MSAPTTPPPAPRDADVPDPGERAFMEWWRLELIAATDAADEQGSETADWLGISKSAYYRRRRGEMPFTAYEFVRLSQRFGLEMTPPADRVPRFGFDVPLEADAAFDEARYLRQLEGTAQLFEGYAEVEILVSATDIPVFYLFAEPDLAALKRYLFGLAIDARGARPFALARAHREHAQFIVRAAQVARAYRSADREEAWGPSPLRSLVYQVLLLVESAAVSPADTEQLFGGMLRVVDRLEAELTAPSESVPGKPRAQDPSREAGELRLWQNRLHATSSIIAVRSPTLERLYVTFDNPNFFASDDPRAAHYFGAHFAALRKRSLRIAGHGAQSPARYCAELRDYVGAGRKRAARLFAERAEVEL